MVSLASANISKILELSPCLFDKLDIIVFETLKFHYNETFQYSAQWLKYFKFQYIADHGCTEKDFSQFRVLGRGGFGLVNGCKRNTTGQLYAMKIMNKKRVKLKRADKLCRNEHSILQLVDSPFVVCLRYALQTKDDLYLILDLMMGGDLGFHLARKGTHTMFRDKCL